MNELIEGGGERLSKGRHHSWPITPDGSGRIDLKIRKILDVLLKDVRAGLQHENPKVVRFEAAAAAEVQVLGEAQTEGPAPDDDHIERPARDGFRKRVAHIAPHHVARELGLIVHHDLLLENVAPQQRPRAEGVLTEDATSVLHFKPPSAWCHNHRHSVFDVIEGKLSAFLITKFGHPPEEI